MEDILNEAELDAKYEKKISYFNKLFPIAIILVFIGAISISLYNWYNDNLRAKTEALSDRLANSIIDSESDYQRSIESLESILKTALENSDAKHKDLALLAMISKMILHQKEDEAIALIDQTLAAPSSNVITMNFMRLIGANLLLDKASLSKEDQDKILEYLKEFKNDSQPFFPTSNLIYALFYQRTGAYNLAVEFANKILMSNKASVILQEQARAVLSSVPKS